MDDSNKKEFWSMLNVCMELSNHPPLSKEAIVVWWMKLSKYDIAAVRDALDKWVDTTSKAPAPSDIANLCKPVTPIYTAIARKADIEANKRHVKEVIDYVSSHFKPTTNHKAWAEKIVANPSAYPDISLKFAREALGYVDAN